MGPATIKIMDEDSTGDSSSFTYSDAAEDEDPLAALQRRAARREAQQLAQQQDVSYASAAAMLASGADASSSGAGGPNGRTNGGLGSGTARGAHEPEPEADSDNDFQISPRKSRRPAGSKQPGFRRTGKGWLPVEKQNVEGAEAQQQALDAYCEKVAPGIPMGSTCAACSDTIHRTRSPCFHSTQSLVLQCGFRLRL